MNVQARGSSAAEFRFPDPPSAVIERRKPGFTGK